MSPIGDIFIAVTFKVYFNSLICIILAGLVWHLLRID